MDINLHTDFAEFEEEEGEKEKKRNVKNEKQFKYISLKFCDAHLLQAKRRR